MVMATSVWVFSTLHSVLKELNGRSLRDIHLASPVSVEVPVVLLALDYQISGHVPRHSIPLMCERNHKVVVLSNVEQNYLPNGECLELVDITFLYDSSAAELPWPSGAPKEQKVFFDRWYVLRDWMAKSETPRVFAMDSDTMLTINVSDFVSHNFLKLSAHDVWIVYNPPRSSLAFALLSHRALVDITLFWNQMFHPDIWTAEFIGRTSPNDMIAMGHYIHTAVGKPYPCWGYGPKNYSGTCDDSIDYGHAKVLDRLVKKGIRAKYTPGTLTIGPVGTANFIEGVVDSNYQHDAIQRFEMHNGEKQLRFHKGSAQLKLRTQQWMPVWGYILEDDTEICAQNHIENIRKFRTCNCNNWCCSQCL